MSFPGTIYNVLEMLINYHDQRRCRYLELSQQSDDASTKLLLEHLAVLDENALKMVRGEAANLDPNHATFMMSGPTVGLDIHQAAECKSHHHPTFEEALDCVFESDSSLEGLVHRLEGSSAAPSVIELAKRIRELERTKSQQIAKFIRAD